MGGAYQLPVQVNEIITLNFVLDTGTSLVTIPADFAMTLVRSGTVREEHILPEETFVQPDGSQVRHPRMIIQSLKIGKRILRNVPAVITDVDGPLLLGQNLLTKMGPWTFDPRKQLLSFHEDWENVPPQEPLGNLTFAEMDDEVDEDSPVRIVKVFFESVAKENFDISWSTLSGYSQEKIIQLVASEGDVSPKLIRSLFENNDSTIRNGFWMSFRNFSEIPLIVPFATYREVKNGPESATVQVKVGEKELPFKVYLEEGHWRMGLIESIENNLILESETVSSQSASGAESH